MLYKILPLVFLAALLLFSCSSMPAFEDGLDADKYRPDADKSVFELTTKTEHQESGLKAGFADDNAQFNYFLNFLNEYKEAVHFELPIQERIIIKAMDADGKSIPDAAVSISASGKIVAEGKTYADGTFLFFPNDKETVKEYQLSIGYQQAKEKLTFQRSGPRQVDVHFKEKRREYPNIPIDILFILDTTGSMGNEIERLKATIEIIKLNISTLSIKPDVRFGMVLYRDREDAYLTRIIPLTKDMDKFQASLNQVTVDGGGDTPEDLQSALKDALIKIDWNPEGIRLGFIITDAAPHLDYDEAYTYVDASKDAKKKAIKLYSIGTGGLDLSGEYVLRQISQYTYAKYIFLTHGEQGESEGGTPDSVSHHTGANFQTDKLESIIIKFTKDELSYLTDSPIEPGEDYFEATKIPAEEKEATLKKLFDAAVSQLVDYSSIRIPEGTEATVLPLIPAADADGATAEYFTDQLYVSFSQNKTFTMVERKDLQAVMEELEMQLSGLVDDASAVKVGNFLGAKLLLNGKIYRKKGKYEIFLKLLRVETGEILSVTKAIVDTELGLTK
ncbi:MAG: VWA domain-containing protein [Spirochaetales bacterium]|nr:VWA domain-containing protein [Spirochaetales bacterium]